MNEFDPLYAGKGLELAYRAFKTESFRNTVFLLDRRKFLFYPLVVLFESLFDRLSSYKGVYVRIGFSLRPFDEQSFKVYLTHLRKLFDQLTEQVFSAP